MVILNTLLIVYFSELLRVIATEVGVDNSELHPSIRHGIAEELDYVKLCLLCLELCSRAEDSPQEGKTRYYVEDPTALWLELARLLEDYYQMLPRIIKEGEAGAQTRRQKYWYDESYREETGLELLQQDRIAADRCLELMRELEAAAVDAGDEASSLFPSRFRSAIWLFATSEDSGNRRSSTATASSTVAVDI